MLSATIDLLDAGHARIERTLRAVRVDDLSPVGFRFSSREPLAIGTLVQIDLGGHSDATARIDEHVDGTYRCTFLTPLTMPVIADGRWPRSVRIAVFLVAGISAWIAAATLLKAVG